MLAYALTVFLGAFLLFQVQPLIGKYILPWFGGGPAVWSACLLFFQLVLLVGYLYAHGLVRLLSSRAARVLHVSLLLVSLAGLVLLALLWGSPVLPDARWKPPDPSGPVGRILLLLSVSVGLPYLLLSSTSPLLQAWAAGTRPEARVYRLYALSNLGSLLALVTYPFVVERFVTLRGQAWTWSAAYAAFVAGSLVCASKRGAPARAGESAGTVAAPATAVASDSPDARAAPAPRAFWFALAACGSMMLMATTNQMCQEVAAIPLLWVLPLCLYLASFILCFAGERLARRAVFGPALVAASCWAAFVLFRGYTVPIRVQVAAYSAALFAACMVCHGELARTKPGPARLTAFYLTIAAGGAAGGAFVLLVAPRIFRSFWEFHTALFLTGVLAIAALARDRSSWLHRGRPWPAFLVFAVCAALVYYARDPGLFSSGLSGLRDLFSTGGGLFALGGGVAALLLLLRMRLLTTPGRPYLAAACLFGALAFLGFLLVSEIKSSLASAVSVSRNFYGVLTVDRHNKGYPEEERLDLRHGRIVHGFQYSASDKRLLPTTYYTPESGIGLALRFHPRRALAAMRVGVVGLGVGTTAAYGRPGDVFRFYEINPAVVALSEGPVRLFTYLADSPARIEIVPGDARLSLERELAAGAPRAFDVLAVDAFTSDAIPVHLLTREAVAVDLAHLARPDGILALHISNRSLDLIPVVRELSRSLRVPMCLVDRAAKGDVSWGTTWALLAPNGRVLETPEIAGACAQDPKPRHGPLWTDDYSNLFAVVK